MRACKCDSAVAAEGGSLHTFVQTLRPTAWDPVVTNVKRVLLLLVIRTASENEHCFRM